MERKKILFVVNRKNYNIFNRVSAIDSILCSVMIELAKFYTVYVNGKLLQGNGKLESDKAIQKLSETSTYRKFIPGFVKQLFWDLKILKENSELFEEIKISQKPDVIIELLRYGSDLGVKLKAYHRVPLITYFDAPAVEENKFLTGRASFFYGLFNKLENKAIMHSDKVIVYSKTITEYWKERLPEVDEKKFRIFQSLDYSRLIFAQEKQTPEVLTIGFVGSFLKWHKVENLVEAYEIIRQKGLKATLLLVGAGEEFETIKQKVSRSKFCSEIEMTGFVDGEKLKEYRNRINIGVMPGTHWYCMPTKVFEYGAGLIASVAPGTSSIRNMFEDNEEVLFLEDFTSSELALKLEFLLNNRDKIGKLGRNLQNKILKFNTADHASIFYKNIIEEATRN